MDEFKTFNPIGYITFMYINDIGIYSKCRPYQKWEREMRRDTVIGDVFSGEAFLEMTETGSIINDDGCIGNVWINGYNTNLGLCNKGFSQGRFMVDANTWSEICKKADVKVEWCNK